MKKIKSFNFKKHLTIENLIITAVFGVTAFIFLINSLHESYPDEFDNIMGGWLTLKGLIIYKDWFTHHNPFAYWLAGGIEIFTGQSFVKFRLFYAFLMLIFTFGGYFYLKRSLNFEKTKFYLAFILLLGIAATYFWGHMLLADSLSALLLAPVFGLVVLKIYYKSFLNTKDIIFISVLSFLSLLTSMTFSYLVGGIYLVSLFYYFFYPNGLKSFHIKKLLSLVIIIIPYLLFLLYLLITGSFSDYIYHSLQFNQAFYIYNYPRPEGVTFVNPIRYAIVIAQDFHNNFSSLLIQTKDFNFQFPFNITLAVVNTALIIFLLIKRKFLLAFFMLYWLVYSNARSNPLTSKETDYQSAVYIVASLFNMCFAVYVFWEDLKKESHDYPKKLILSVLFLLVLFYSFFDVTYLLRQFSYKGYNKFMGLAPLIYNRPKIAPVINSITNKDDYVWVGPFDFEEIYYLNRKIPTRYEILLPEFAKSPRIQEKMMQELNMNKPKVIYYDKQFSIRFQRPEEYAGFFQKFLDENYVTIDSLNKDKKIYSSNLYKDLHVDYETKLYIKKENVTEVLKKMIELGYITKSN